MMKLTRYGAWEMVLGSIVLAALAAAGLLFLPPLAGWMLLALWAVLWLWMLSFFRDPVRRIPPQTGLLLSPADGKITDITDLDTAEYLDGPCVRIGIFLSVFNVHLNRAPCDGTVDYVKYRRGKMVNAMRADAGELNESNAVGLKDTPAGKLLVRQITGLIARRIVCEIDVGDTVARGQVFGMIKFGSRTELIIPRQSGLLIAVRVGQKVRAGCDVLAQVTDVLADRPAGPTA